MTILRGSLISVVFGLVGLGMAQENRPTRDVIYTKILDDTNVQGINPQFAHAVINDYGQVVVTGYFSRGARSGNGIYISDQFGFRKVIEEGDSLDGGTVQSLAATPSMDGPNGYFMGSSVVGYAATIRTVSPPQTYFGFYKNSGSRSNRTARLVRQLIGTFGTVNCSADANDRGNWAFSAQAPDGSLKESFGSNTSTTNLPGPLTFTANGHAYTVIGGDMVKADLGSLGGAYLRMTGQPTEYGLNQQSGILYLSGGSPSLFSARNYQLPFKAGSGFIGGISYSAGVAQMTVSKPGTTSIRDDGSNHFETPQGFQMNASGVTTNIASNYTTYQTDLLWSNSRGIGIRGNSNVTGPAAISPSGSLAYPWNNGLGYLGVEMEAPVQVNRFVSYGTVWQVPEILQVGQPLFGDYLYAFHFEAGRSFNKYNEVVFRYYLTNGQTGIMKAKLDVPIIASYDAHVDPVSHQAIVTVTGDNFDPAKQYSIYANFGMGTTQSWLFPTANPRVWTSNLGAPGLVPVGTAFDINVEKTNGDYSTPTVRIVAH